MFSTSLRNFSSAASKMSISRLVNRLSDRGSKMATNRVTTEVVSEWAKARQVQQRFMQTPVPANGAVDYGAECRQVQELGGDCYEFTPLPDNRLALAVGDASGKGLAAALMISNVQSSLRTAALLAGDDAATILRAVNRQVYGSSLSDRYATLFYGVFDPQSRTLRYVNAGHNPPMVIRRDGSVTWLETGGAPVGMFPDWNYEEGSVQFNPGDRLLAYTDGVTEAVNRAGEEWGVEGLRRAATEIDSRSAGETVHGVFAALDEFSGGCQTDDATILAFEVY
jgi:sigma-B regulation protein RsbU (phosphoserine phosphatase)